MAKKILVVDDDEGILEAFTAMLSNAGYDVVACPEAENVYTLIKKTSPDLILLDVLLSGLDGRDICKRLKNESATKNIPIVMVSAHPSAAKSTLDVGANDFIPKPFEMDDLLKKVAIQFKNQQC